MNVFSMLELRLLTLSVVSASCFWKFPDNSC